MGATLSHRVASSIVLLAPIVMPCTFEKQWDYEGHEITDGAVNARTPDGCCRRCMEAAWRGCRFWTFVPQTRTCYLKHSEAGRRHASWRNVPKDAAEAIVRFTSGAITAETTPEPFVCKSDWDCSLGGVCNAGVCKCDSWLTGSDCSLLNFEPLDRTKLGYMSNSHSSWGGSALKGSDGKWHLYVTEVACNSQDSGTQTRCGLSQWANKAQVAHAVADAPEGPYVRRDLVLGQMHANPMLLKSPVDGSWHLYTINTWNGPIVVINSTNEGATWTQVEVMVSPFQNPGPAFLPNGSLVMFYRHEADLGTSSCSQESIGMHYAKQPWQECQGGTNPVFSHTAEDPSVFRDHRGNWHMLMNAQPHLCTPKYNAGAHAWSRDGLHWSEPRIGAFTTTAHFGNGDFLQCQRRERPVMLLEGDRPSVLLTGVTGCPTIEGTPLRGPDDSFTLAQRLKRPADDGATPTTNPPPQVALLVKGGFGVVNCPAGSTIMSTSTPCEQAAIELGYVFYGVRDILSYPKGCFYNEMHKEMVFNAHRVGSPEKSSQPICAVEREAHSAPEKLNAEKVKAVEEETNTSSSSGHFFTCEDDWDCSLGGSCWKGSCLCDSWLSGEDCSYLNFEPVDKSRLGYLDDQHSSWGGNAVYGRDKRWHLFVAEIACKQGSRQRCGLGDWTTHSQVAHAVSDAPDGPYERRSLALPMMHHNPTVHVSSSGLWYLYSISSWNGPIVVSKSDDQGKSWSDGRPGKQVSPYQNPGPLILPNGSVLMYYRDDMDLPEPTCCKEGIGVSLCPGPMEPCESPRSPVFNHTAEDPFVFIDHRGNYHMLMNVLPYLCEPKYQQGGHAWSRDGVRWSEPRVGAFNTTIQFTDGTATTCKRRERPQIVRDSYGIPLVLFTGLTGCPKDAFSGTAHNGHADSFTLAQLFKPPSIQQQVAAVQNQVSAGVVGSGWPGVMAAILATVGLLWALWRLLARGRRDVSYSAVKAHHSDEESAPALTRRWQRRPPATVMGDARSPG